MISRAGVWRTEGFERVCGDNGAWADFQAGREFDEDAYERFLDWFPISPDWLVLPDIVAGGLHSLELSLRYMNRCRAVSDLVLIAVQNGMSEDDVSSLVGPHVGIFLGGSTEWKLHNAIRWGRFCRHHNCYYHFARANSIKRISLAIAAGADSFDGSSASRYAVTTPGLTYASRQQDMFVGQ